MPAALMSEELNKVEQLFHAALGLASPAERAGYLARACGSDAVLRTRVEKLLRAYETAGQFLDPETPPVQDRFPFGTPDLPPSEKPGDQIGHYTLGEQIGEGGCCVVYLARQVEPVRREVALKLVKVGMDTRQVVARFEAERQALALMDHPHIAKVFDAGVTTAGRPYFVMELVRGLPITQYCEQHRLSLKQRLELFVQVAHAVQHAHQKGVIHRDLKPSNILVTTGDSECTRPASPTRTGAEAASGAGEAVGQGSAAPSPRHDQPSPRIIDFGIAKAIQAQLTERPAVTWFGQLVGTPAYMSPEQAGMRNEDIDVRTDIYSLGVLLYELLTGVTPFGQKTLAEAGFDEIQRIIQEREPPKPSARLHGFGQKLEEVAHCRRTEPGVLWRSVRGDLDWIVMKALEKDRRRRYETAIALAEDIQRHLTHEPVLAGPPSAVYRARKFARRHRVWVAAAAAATLALVVGLSLALVGWRRALQAGTVAGEERDRAVQAEADAKELLELFSDKLVADDEMVGLLETAARLAREKLGPTNQAALSFAAPLARNMGRLGEWTNALELYLSLINADPGNSDYWQCGHAAALAAARPEVARELRQDMAKRFAASRNPTDTVRLAKALLLPPENESHLETATACANRALQAQPKDLSCRIAQGLAEYRRGHWSEALKWLQEGERSEDPNVAALAFCFGAMARRQMGQTTDAQEALSRAWRLLRVPLDTGQLAAKDWPEVVYGFVARGEAERLILGREVSPPLTTELLAQAREKWKSVREPLLRGEALAQQGKWRESRDAYIEALNHPSFDWAAAEEQSTMRCLSLQMATAFARCGDSTNHQRLCRLLLDLHPDKPLTPKAERDATARSDRYAKACFLNARSLSPELRQAALELARFAVANQRKRHDHNPGWVCQTGGMAEFYAGQPERALALLKEAEKDDNPLVKGIAMVFRAMVLQELNRPQEAARVLRNAVSLLSTLPMAPSSLYWWDSEQYKLALEQARQLIPAETR